MRIAPFLLTLSLLLLATSSAAQESPPSLAIVVPVDYPTQIPNVAILAESLRHFGGELEETPVWAYLPRQLDPALAAQRERLAGLGVQIHSVEVPPEAMDYVLGAKPFILAQAERDAEGRVDVLAILAPNTIVLAEPRAFLLPEGIDLGCSTVHHQNVGSPSDEEPDLFWRRIYELLGVPSEAVWSNVTLADEVRLRLYFNAGSFAVRPAAGLLREWARAFERCVGDETLAALCEEGPHNVFLHQAALSAATLRHLPRERVQMLPDSYSVPLFFERFHGGPKVFDSLMDVVTMRFEFRFEDLPADWTQQVQAPPGTVEWIAERFPWP